MPLLLLSVVARFAIASCAAARRRAAVVLDRCMPSCCAQLSPPAYAESTDEIARRTRQQAAAAAGGDEEHARKQQRLVGWSCSLSARPIVLTASSSNCAGRAAGTAAWHPLKVVKAVFVQGWQMLACNDALSIPRALVHNPLPHSRALLTRLDPRSISTCQFFTLFPSLSRSADRSSRDISSRGASCSPNSSPTSALSTSMSSTDLPASSSSGSPASSASSDVPKRRKVTNAGDKATAANSLQLVRGKNLPVSLEFSVLRFLTIGECADLLLLSKDTQRMVQERFKLLRALRIYSADHPQAISMLRFCRQLRVLSIFCSFGKHEMRVRQLLADALKQNATTMEDFHGNSSAEVLSALAGCRNLTVFELWPKSKESKEYERGKWSFEGWHE